MNAEKGTPRGAVKTLIVLALIVVIGVVVYAKNASRIGKTRTGEIAVTAQGQPATDATTRPALPTLIDLGSDKCIPCKLMAPILEEMKTKYQGYMEVQIIDVWKDEEAGKKYGASIIPTQIFYDAWGMERFRHEGFFSREDILAKWKELGVELADTASAPAANTP